MNEKSILNKVRTLLGLEVKLEVMKLTDGVSMLEAESFEAGQPVFILTEDEQRIALPIGEYELEDGRVLVVIEEGMIAEIKEVKEEEEMPEAPAQEPAEVEEEVEASNEAPQAKKIVESIVKESFFSEMEALKKENEELKAQLSAQNNEVAVEEKEEEVAPVELAEEPKPISFNPENTQATEVFKFASKRNASTMDSVLNRISNIK
jgi:hypothetical protein